MIIDASVNVHVDAIIVVNVVDAIIAADDVDEESP